MSSADLEEARKNADIRGAMRLKLREYDTGELLNELVRRESDRLWDTYRAEKEQALAARAAP